MIEAREAWSRWVTPGPLRQSPVHRWYAFPHSFTGELVEALIEEWDLGANDCVLDPFVGAGTTVVAAKARGVPATGCDLSPFATFVSSVKTCNYSLRELENIWDRLQPRLERIKPDKVDRRYPQLVIDAIPPGVLSVFEQADASIHRMRCHKKEKAFFRLALLATLPQYSRAVAAGGWLKWIKKRTSGTTVAAALTQRIRMMLDDLRHRTIPGGMGWRIRCGDARRLPDRDARYSAVITSPPYPNRHDYTRVFGVELLFGFLDWEETRRLRYQSIHSHPEARPRRPIHGDYVAPRRLLKTVEALRGARLDAKILNMIEGYFLDMHLCLRECKRVTQRGGPIAFVVGNAQYNGHALPVDEYLADIGQTLGLSCERILAVRYRGNSAQQMREFGRRPSRESIVVFRNT